MQWKRLLREVVKFPSLQVFKDWDQPFLKTTFTDKALLWVGLGLVQGPLTQGSDSQQAGDRGLLGYTGAKALQQPIQMRSDILIMSFLPGKRSPLLQRSCIHTHQCVIKLKSTDVVGWDVSCGQRLRNLSNNSTFICGEIKNQTLSGGACKSLRAHQLHAYIRRSLSSQTPIRRNLCNKMCSFSQNQVFGSQRYIAHSFYYLPFATEKCTFFNGTKPL